MRKDTFTTFEISQICNVFITTVAHWIDEGKLPAHRTPGGHRRVLRQDLLQFLSRYEMPIPESLFAEERKVLIVDDNRDTVATIEKALRAKNPDLVIRTAEDGFEAGKQVAMFRPHVVILDVVLPGLDGLQVCQNLRKDPLTSSIHVIIITGHDEQSTRAEFQSLGVDTYMEKPLNLATLVARVEKLLGKGVPPGKSGAADAKEKR